MNEPISEEILSAYLDGELPPRERAEVEQWLEKSPEGRRSLEDFRRLSSLFAKLPRTEIPQEFPTKVLQLAERRMLLPETVAVSVRRRIHRRILAIGGAIASAAAVLFVIVHFRDPGVPGPEVTFEGDRPAPARPQENPPPRSRQTDEAPENRDLVAGKDVASGTRSMAPPAAAPSVADRPSPGPAEESSATDPLVAGGPLTKSLAKSAARTASSPAAEKNGTPEEIAREKQQRAEVSRVIDRLGDTDTDNDQLSVVTIRIDGAEGLMLVQKILVNNGVLPSGIPAAPGKKADASFAKDELKSRAAAGAPEGDARECLIVIAEPERVIASLTEVLDREDAAIRLSVGAPLQIASLDAETQKLLKQVETEGGLGGGAKERRREAVAFKDSAADKTAEVGGIEKGADDAVPGVDAAKSDRDGNPLPAPPGTSEKKKAADMPRGESAKSGSASLRQEAPKADNRAAKKKDAASAPEFDRAETGLARQFVVPVPKEIEQRQLALTPAPPQAGRDSETLESLPGPAPKAKKRPSHEGKALADGVVAKRAPALVRVLFVIEPGAAQPAEAAPVGKAPCDDAS